MFKMCCRSVVRHIRNSRRLLSGKFIDRFEFHRTTSRNEIETRRMRLNNNEENIKIIVWNSKNFCRGWECEEEEIFWASARQHDWGETRCVHLQDLKIKSLFQWSKQLSFEASFTRFCSLSRASKFIFRELIMISYAHVNGLRWNMVNSKK